MLLTLAVTKSVSTFNFDEKAYIELCSKSSGIDFQHVNEGATITDAKRLSGANIQRTKRCDVAKASYSSYGAGSAAV